MPLKSILISTFLTVASPLALGDFSKKLYLCDEEEFNDARDDYNISPTGVYIRIDYGQCLVLRGQVGAGMLMLQELSKQRAVPAAYFIAMHTKSGGTMTIETDINNIDEAIDDLKYVRTLINLDPSYPYNGWYYYEYDAQMDLNSLYRIPKLYRTRFQEGATNLENDYINHSTGSPYNETIGSLNALIEHAHYCANTSDENYFKPAKYKLTIKACQILKEEAITLKPLEEQRLEILENKTCSREGLLDCEPYKTLTNEMISIITKATTELNEIFEAYNKAQGTN